MKDMKVFDPSELKKLYQPENESSGEENGQVTIIGGSKLFHGAPIFALKVASRIVDMVFFASPERSLESVVSKIKASLSSFIWVPWEDTKAYIDKSDAVLIGPGFKRFTSETQNPNDKIQMKNDGNGKKTREITEGLLKSFPKKKWVIDAGSLQTMDADWIPEGAIITPNRREFGILFGTEIQDSRFTIQELEQIVSEKAKKYRCVIILKGPEAIVASPNNAVLIKGGNAGMTKGGTGDTLAGLTVALLAKNDPFLSACSASYIVKAAGDELFKSVGANYNADDLAGKIPETLNSVMGNERPEDR